MKKLLIVLCALCMIPTMVNAAEEAKVQQVDFHQKMVEARVQREKAFEKRLGLTEVQKLKARQIRQNAHEKLRPIMEQIKTKKQEAEMIRRSRMAVQMQEEKLTAIDKELKVLEKKASDIRKSNMKEFESILTREQKRTLKQMKKEGRKRYHSNHPSKKMFPANSFGHKLQIPAK